jgi:hypothetical protein
MNPTKAHLPAPITASAKAFLGSEHGGLGLDVMRNGETAAALQRALPSVLKERVADLQGQRLDADGFNALLTPVAGQLVGGSTDAEFTPQLRGSAQVWTQDRLRALLATEATQVLTVTRPATRQARPGPRRGHSTVTGTARAGRRRNWKRETRGERSTFTLTLKSEVTESLSRSLSRRETEALETAVLRGSATEAMDMAVLRRSEKRAVPAGVSLRPGTAVSISCDAHRPGGRPAPSLACGAAWGSTTIPIAARSPITDH